MERMVCIKRVNIAGLKLLFLENLVCTVGPWLASRNLNLEGFPPFPDKNCSLCLNCIYKECGLC